MLRDPDIDIYVFSLDTPYLMNQILRSCFCALIKPQFDHLMDS